MQRLLDTVLREDLFGAVSRSTPEGDSCLQLQLTPQTRWWLPVQAGGPLCAWRAAAPFLWEEHQGVRRRLDDPQQLFARCADLLDEHDALAQELSCCLEQLALARDEQAAWFASQPRVPTHWAESLMFFDRLAAFQDHPYYPTARAKVGFTADDLQRYAPEWGPQLQLRWVGVEPERVSLQGELPAWWPSPASLRLPSGNLAVPLHPHTAEQLGVEGTPHLWVRPTLSVRSLEVVDHPEVHLKLPLFMRSLSFKNIRKVKPDTIHDGHAVQTLLAQAVAQSPELRGRVLLTDESCGFSVDGRADLGCIVRRYPEAELEGCRVLPVAALAASFPAGGSVLEFFGPAFLQRYLELTLRVHLTLWSRYGIALESNQQNSLIVVAPDGALRLLFKDNDAARIYRGVAAERLQVPHFQDPCIEVDDWLPLAHMFLTITLQLNLLPFASGEEIGEVLQRVLSELPQEQLQRAEVRRWLLEPEFHPVKRLFSAGTLFSKARTGAADINKHYGLTGPNPLRAWSRAAAASDSAGSLSRARI